MSMKINSNGTAIVTNNYLHRAEKTLSKSTERLSSGYKINNASDAPAGYAISSKMRAQIKSLEKAQDNADTAVDFVKTGDGAMEEVQAMIQRMGELAVKAANGTMTTEDREAIQDEVDQLCQEIERIAKQTDFNDQPILDGNYEYRGYTNNLDVKVMSYSDQTTLGEYKGLSVDVSTKPMVDDNGNPVLDKEGKQKYEYTVNNVTGMNKIAPNMKAEIVPGTNVLRMANTSGVEINLEIQNTAGFSGSLDLDLKKIGAMRIQIGDNEGQVMEMSVPEVSLKKMGLDDIDMTTQDNARKSIEKIQGALDYSSAVRSKFGAYQNRLEHAVASLDVTVENLNNSYSTITDTDMAEEMTEFSKLQVMQQAATSMLAQANQFPQEALQLLQ